jgi:diaminohydroxyphosphoribosylaminopyrimidine deaminase/5-amino-6-(5-phosphoribosylamino)uracil reductase
LTLAAPAAFMRRAIRLALGARHRTSPNPTVGCVVVRDGEVVGEGVTQRVGGPHAEVEALRAAGERARGGDVFVTLEPCCHHGRTPPCTDAIVAAGVRRVFAGVIDPNPVVAGKGVRLLESAGIETHVGLLDAENRRLIAPFRRYVTNARPWITLKAGLTLDGCIATASGHSKWITGEAARRDAHRLRARADAVMVGVGTALADDPQLTVRMVKGEDPLRVLLDSALRVPTAAALMGRGTLVFHAPEVSDERRRAVAATGAETQAVPRAAGGGLDLQAVLGALAGRGLVSVLVEGGGRLHGSLISAGLADEACFYLAPKLVGRGLPVLDLPSVATVGEGWSLDEVETRRLGQDVRVRGVIRYPVAPRSSED